MRKLIALLLTALLLGVGSGLAQTDDASATVPVDDVVTENYWAGVSFGYPGIYGHFGLKDIIGQGGDVRANLGFSYIGGGIVLGANALFDINLQVDAPLGLYVGGGPIIRVGGGVDTDNDGDIDSGGTGVGVEGIVGLEYRLSDFDFNSGAVFFELGPVITIPGGFNFLGRLGFNYYF